MKNTRYIALILILSTFLLNSCAVFIVDGDKGKHKGWYKNTNNPHHPKTTNPVHTKKKKENKK